MSFYVGIDVGKERPDAAWSPATRPGESFPHDAAGHAALRGLLARQAPERGVLEATGGYERPRVAQRLDAPLPGVVVNPRQVRDVARATGKLAKTGRLDAAAARGPRALARYAEAVKPPVRPLPDEQTRALRETRARRRQRVGRRAAERGRLGQARAARIRRGVESRIRALDRQIAGLDGERGDLIEARPAWPAKADLRTTVPGGGIRRRGR